MQLRKCPIIFSFIFLLLLLPRSDYYIILWIAQLPGSMHLLLFLFWNGRTVLVAVCSWAQLSSTAVRVANIFRWNFYLWICVHHKNVLISIFHNFMYNLCEVAMWRLIDKNHEKCIGACIAASLPWSALGTRQRFGKFKFLVFELEFVMEMCVCFYLQSPFEIELIERHLWHWKYKTE